MGVVSLVMAWSPWSSGSRGRAGDEADGAVAGVDLDLAEAGRGQPDGQRPRVYRVARVRQVNEAEAPARLTVGAGEHPAGHEHPGRLGEEPVLRGGRRQVMQH